MISLEKENSRVSLTIVFEAQYKNKLYTKWCNWMLEQIEKLNFREKSRNWIAPSKAITIKWCAEAWDEISLENLKNGCKKVFMDPSDLDEEMSKYDGVTDFSNIKFDDVIEEPPIQAEEVLDS